MSSNNLKEVLRKIKYNVDKDGKVKVMVALNTAEPDESSLARFRRMKFSIDRVVGNKLIGSIPENNLEKLKRDPQVSETELSVPLKTHSKLRS